MDGAGAKDGWTAGAKRQHMPTTALQLVALLLSHITDKLPLADSLTAEHLDPKRCSNPSVQRQPTLPDGDRVPRTIRRSYTSRSRERKGLAIAGGGLRGRIVSRLG